MTRSAGGFFAGSLLLTAFFTTQLAIRFQDPFPPLSVSLSTQVSSLHDFTGIAAGLRRLAADIAWIQTLQYYGTAEEGQSDFESDNGMGDYPLLLSYCQRVTRIDPFFSYAYYYGAGSLGWNLNRWDEAEILLRQGIQNNPHDARLKEYLGSIAYEHNHDVSKLAEFLESFIYDPECPNLLRSILANIYKKQKLFGKALRVWVMVYDTGDPTYRTAAETHIRELIPLVPLGLKTP
ncbi:MAG: hypothetical protein WC859_07520 [Elusimicrobiota bacterium]|jgi:tetratricopeptide (TPR) repeat protein